MCYCSIAFPPTHKAQHSPGRCSLEARGWVGWIHLVTSSEPLQALRAHDRKKSYIYCNTSQFHQSQAFVFSKTKHAFSCTLHMNSTGPF